MSASGKDSNTVMQYEQTLLYKKKEKNCLVTEEHFQLNSLISWRKFREIAN